MSDDAISRQAVIRAIYDNTDRLEIAQAVRNLPPVTPKQRTGHWIKIDDFFMAKCSECGEFVDSRMISKYPYCHCGAKMEEQE